jgi:glycosyltransferase involved in cell wall biosynthesis
MKIVLLIRSLNIGGAERQVVETARGLSLLGYDVRVFTFYSGGYLSELLQAHGIELVCLKKQGRWDALGFIDRLRRELKKISPDCVYCFLTSSNVLGLVAGRMAAVPRIVWGVRASNMVLKSYDRVSRLEFFLARLLSRFSDAIIFNSDAGARFHLDAGFCGRAASVIGNGINTDEFFFNEAGRRRVRAELGIHPGHPVLGLSARLDPMKGHKIALQALSNISSRFPTARLLCAGGGNTSEDLRAFAKQLGVADRVLWMGPRTDIRDVYSAVDVACSSAIWGEGFSNALAEAMACERVCIATDVGDSARILGDCGWIVPPGDVDALATAWTAALSLGAPERAEIGARARQKIKNEFSVRAMAVRTAAVLVG